MNLHATVQALMRDGKGVLALDGDAAVFEKLFADAGIPSSEEMRVAYRGLLLSTPGIEEFLSAVILSEEGMRESDASGVVFPELLASKNILTCAEIDGNPDYTASRIQEYKSLALVAAKKSITIEAQGTLAGEAFREHVKDFADFARACQEKSIVPILALELAPEGAYSASQAEDALIAHLSFIADSLAREDIDHKALILESGMARSGSDTSLPARSVEVAQRTVRALRASVPEDVGGILFSSIGETPEEATADLNAIARLEPFTWPIAFCFSGALHAPALAAWAGKPENIPEAQAVFFERLALNVRADGGGYGPGMEAR